jgi:hypothetical protein
MLVELAKHARRAAEQLATRPEVLQSTLAAHGPSNGDANHENAAPPLLLHGGAYRGLAVLPEQAGSASNKLVAANLGPDASVLTGVGHDVILCQEGWDVPLARVAADIIQSRRDYADFAARVLTRSDVAWTPLIAPRSSLAPVADNPFAAAMPTMTQVL